MPEEAITLLKEIRDEIKSQSEPKIKMLRIEDVANILGVNRSKASKLWDSEDFPRYCVGT